MIKKVFINFLLFVSLVLLLVNIYNFFSPIDYRNDPYLIKGYFSKENKKILDFISEGNRSEILSYNDTIKKLDEQYSI